MDVQGEHRIVVDAAKMFPEAARRVEILEEMKRTWPKIVGLQAAKYSQPYNLGVNELWICVTNPLARNTLIKSKGSIARRLARQFSYDFGDDFVMTLTDKIPVPNKPAQEKQAHKEEKIVVDEEKIRQYMKDAPPTLPEEINYAISRIQAIFEERERINAARGRT